MLAVFAVAAFPTISYSNSIPAAAPAPAVSLLDSDTTPALRVDFPVELPAVRVLFREMFELSRDLRLVAPGARDRAIGRMKEGAPWQQVAAALALEENGLLRGDLVAQRDALREPVQKFEREVHPWRVQLLTAGLLGSRRLASPESLPIGLLDQFEDDDVRGNADVAAELYLAGLQSDPVRFLPPLAARQMSKLDTLTTSQPGIYGSSLLLQFALMEPGWYASQRTTTWYDLSRSRHKVDPSSTAKYGPVATDAIIETVRAYGKVDYLVWTSEALRRHASDNRVLARCYLEVAPHSLPELYYEILAEPGYEMRFQRGHAAACLMLRNPEQIGTVRFADAVVNTAMHNSFRLVWLLGNLLSNHEEGSPLYSLEHYIYTDADRIAGMPIKEAVGRIQIHRDTFRNRLLSRVADLTDPEQQLAVAKIILAIHPVDESGIVSDILVSHFTADDVASNAVTSRYLLESIDGDYTASLLGGFEAGLSTGDWQLVGKTGFWLAALGTEPDFRLDDPRAMKLMVEQLRNDQSDGNKGMAQRYLYECGTAPKALLEEARLRYPDDAQLQWCVQDILWGMEQKHKE
jgi:hypothetical protein